MENYRRFEAGPDPFGKVWLVEFQWQQNGISIRHADTVDVKFALREDGSGPKQEKIVELRHPDLLKLSEESSVPLTDPWACRLAALHIRKVIETEEDIEKTILSPSYEELRRYAAILSGRQATDTPLAERQDMLPDHARP